MGLASAAHLLKAGFGLCVYNCTAEKARPLLEQGASSRAQPGGVVVTMASDDRAVEQVTLGPNGFLSRLGDGAVNWGGFDEGWYRRLRILRGRVPFPLARP